MFNLNKIKEVVDHNLTNSQIGIVVVNASEIDLCVTSICPESGMKFGQNYRFRMIDLLHEEGDNIVTTAEQLANSIRLHPDYNR